MVLVNSNPATIMTDKDIAELRVLLSEMDVAQAEAEDATNRNPKEDAR